MGLRRILDGLLTVVAVGTVTLAGAFVVFGISPVGTWLWRAWCEALASRMEADRGRLETDPGYAEVLIDRMPRSPLLHGNGYVSGYGWEDDAVQISFVRNGVEHSYDSRTGWDGAERRGSLVEASSD